MDIVEVSSLHPILGHLEGKHRISAHTNYVLLPPQEEVLVVHVGDQPFDFHVEADELFIGV
jgi:hypothetical protein